MSRSQILRAPGRLRAHSLGWAYLATPLADRCRVLKPDVRNGPVVMLGRICPLKGQHLGVRLCRELGLPLVLAGPVGGLRGPRELDAALQDPDHRAHHNPDVRYYLHQVRPYVDGELIRWIGSAEGTDRDRLLLEAPAALFPVQWEEPGGTAVIEALACGTPVVGLRRGCLPELVEHRRTGLLADNADDLRDYLKRVQDINPDDCRRACARRFSPAVMAERYLGFYREVLNRN